VRWGGGREAGEEFAEKLSLSASGAKALSKKGFIAALEALRHPKAVFQQIIKPGMILESCGAAAAGAEALSEKKGSYRSCDTQKGGFQQTIKPGIIFAELRTAGSGAESPHDFGTLTRRWKRPLFHGRSAFVQVVLRSSHGARSQIPAR